MKEHGGTLSALHESCALYSAASLGAPTHGSLLLNLMHTLEVRARSASRCSKECCKALHESCTLYSAASLVALAGLKDGETLPTHLSASEVRADYFAALVHGVRFCDTVGGGLAPIAAAVRGHVERGKRSQSLFQ